MDAFDFLFESEHKKVQSDLKRLVSLAKNFYEIVVIPSERVKEMSSCPSMNILSICSQTSSDREHNLVVH